MKKTKLILTVMIASLMLSFAGCGETDATNTESVNYYAD